MIGSIATTNALGLVRTENQDRLFSNNVNLFVVADGMGGHSEGADAAEETIAAIKRIAGSVSQKAIAGDGGGVVPVIEVRYRVPTMRLGRAAAPVDIFQERRLRSAF